MGLDMYLQFKADGFDELEDVGYWRKANAIHKFFVDNVQNGVDDQKEYKVPYEVFLKLKGICDELLKKATEEGYVPASTDFKASNALKKECEDKLPTQGGFLFGSLEYDWMYFNDIELTLNIINPVLEGWEEADGDYYYSCWW